MITTPRTIASNCVCSTVKWKPEMMMFANSPRPEAGGVIRLQYHNSTGSEVKESFFDSLRAERFVLDTGLIGPNAFNHQSFVFFCEAFGSRRAV